MGLFRRVEADKAGHEALGILIPPARQTFLILRARSLACDLILYRSQDDRFHVLTHDEASAAAQAVYSGLRGGLAQIETLLLDTGTARLVVRVGSYTFLACPRLAGQPYTPLEQSAAEIASLLASFRAIFLPIGEQEVYFNTRFFERSP